MLLWLNSPGGYSTGTSTVRGKFLIATEKPALSCQTEPAEVRVEWAQKSQNNFFTRMIPKDINGITIRI
jgi:hypothetical protein